MEIGCELTVICVCSVLQIASLQNDIWDLEQEESSGGDANLQQRIVGKLLLAWLKTLHSKLQKLPVYDSGSAFEARPYNFWNEKQYIFWNSLAIKRTLAQLSSLGGFAAPTLRGLVWPLTYGSKR